MIEKVILGLGSNAGNRFLNISRTLKLISLSRNLDILKLSSIYETEPWGFKNQNNFLNCVAVCICRARPYTLLKELKSIEIAAGRMKRKRWRERESDIDILFYGRRVIIGKKLIIPHPEIQFRNFVLFPLNEIVPGFIHPVLKRSVRYLYMHSSDQCKVSVYKRQVI